MHPLLRHSGALVAAALGLPALAGFALVRPAWRPGLTQRFGVAGPWRPGALWVHAASVGEVFAASRLFAPLEERGHTVCVSATTPTGRDVLLANHAGRTPRFAPLDHPWCVASALSRATPRALVLVETELWPIWIAAAARRGIPVVVVSARLSERSVPRYRRLAPWFRSLWPVLRVGARSEDDAERFVSLGMAPDHVRVTGDLKFDAPPSRGAPAAEIARFLAGRSYWAAVSTHPGEERAALDAHAAACAAGFRGALVLAPRHLDRIAEVEAMLRNAGTSFLRRSRLGPDGAVEEAFGEASVLLLDTLGEVPSLLSDAELVFVGGTLAPVGGHNILEPAASGRPALFGPHLRNVTHAAAALESAGAALRVADAEALRDRVADWLQAPDPLARRARAASAFMAEHGGATERTVAYLESTLAAARGASA